MTHAMETIRAHEDSGEDTRPLGTRAVSLIGSRRPHGATAPIGASLESVGETGKSVAFQREQLANVPVLV